MVPIGTSRPTPKADQPSEDPDPARGEIGRELIRSADYAATQNEVPYNLASASTRIMSRSIWSKVSVDRRLDDTRLMLGRDKTEPVNPSSLRKRRQLAGRGRAAAETR